MCVCVMVGWPQRAKNDQQDKVRRTECISVQGGQRCQGPSSEKAKLGSGQRPEANRKADQTGHTDGDCAIIKYTEDIEMEAAALAVGAGVTNIERAGPQLAIFIGLESIVLDTYTHTETKVNMDLTASTHTPPLGGPGATMPSGRGTPEVR